MCQKIHWTLPWSKPTNRAAGAVLFHQQVTNDKKGIADFLKQLLVRAFQERIAVFGERGKDAFFAFQSVILIVLIPQGGKLLEQVLKFGKG